MSSPKMLKRKLGLPQGAMLPWQEAKGGDAKHLDVALEVSKRLGLVGYNPNISHV